MIINVDRKTRFDPAVDQGQGQRRLTQRDTEFAVKTILDAMSDAWRAGTASRSAASAASRSTAARRGWAATRAAASR
jgi:hypothetical protein